jgi:hypothetical protein
MDDVTPEQVASFVERLIARNAELEKKNEELSAELSQQDKTIREEIGAAYREKINRINSYIKESTGKSPTAGEELEFLINAHKEQVAALAEQENKKVLAVTELESRLAAAQELGEENKRISRELEASSASNFELIEKNKALKEDLATYVAAIELASKRRAGIDG